MAKYRILSIDGGGIRGLIPAVLLQRLEAAVPGWLDQTDLIAGTSTGGIIAIGLAHGLTPTDMHNLYYKNGPEIFYTPWWNSLRSLGSLVGAKHPNNHLHQVIRQEIQGTQLKDLKKKVLISSFNVNDTDKKKWKAKFFHNYERAKPSDYPDGQPYDPDGYLTAAEVAMYTSAAPTYFPSRGTYIDGGVAANNPGMAAIAQTQDTRYRIDPRPNLDEIVMLSLGTGDVHTVLDGKNLNWGYVQWGWKIRLLSIMFNGVVEVPDYQCYQLLGDSNYKRINPDLPIGQSFEMDDTSKRDALVKIASDVNLDKVVKWLCDTWLP